jgi:hypothetical protein
MTKIMFRITYRLQAHNLRRFEGILLNEIMPLVRDLGIRPPSIWKNFVGNAGEMMELWEFESITDFEEKWRKLMGDPRLEEIFKVTGPMVEEEQFSLFDPLGHKENRTDLEVRHYSV